MADDSRRPPINWDVSLRGVGPLGRAKALWAIIEDEFKQGIEPRTGHIAEAPRHGQPVLLSADLQRYIAELLEPTQPRKRRPRKKMSMGERVERAYEFLAQVDELRAREIAATGRRRGSLKTALSLIREGNLAGIEKQYRRAMRLTGRAKPK